MPDIELSAHAKTMLEERKILETPDSLTGL